MGIDPLVRETLDTVARRRRIVLAIIGAVLVLVAAAGAAGLWIAARSLRQINETSDYLTECTTPSTATEFHLCYEDAQRRTAEAVRVLFENDAYNRELIICVLSIPIQDRTVPAIERCEEESRRQAGQ